MIANAGIVRLTDEEPGQTAAVWKDIVDTNLTGVFNTVHVALPTMRAAGKGGAIVLTSSSAGLRPTPMLRTGSIAYTATKTALVGLMRQLAGALAAESIRVNTVHPTGVATGMTMNETMQGMFEAAMRGEDTGLNAMQNAMPIDILQPEDIADAVAFLVSDQAKWITGAALPVDAGFCVR